MSISVKLKAISQDDLFFSDSLMARKSLAKTCTSPRRSTGNRKSEQSVEGVNLDVGFAFFVLFCKFFFSRTFLWIGNYGSVDWNITVREERGGVSNERVWGRIKDEITGAFSRASLFKMSSFCRVGRVRFGEDFWIKITRVGFITRRHM